MIRRNQSSSSPPGPAYSSPPVSPTVTQVSSRSPTPSPPEIHDPPRDAARRSPSPHRSPTPSDHASKMGSRLAQTSTHEPDQQQQQQQHHERPAPQPAPQPAPRPQMHPSVSAPAGRLPRLLPADLSQYTDGAFPSDIVSTSSTSLAELAHLIRLQSYQEQRRCHARVRLHRSLVANALSARLVHCGELVHRTLVDHFRSDDKKSFAQLYNALHDVRNSCDATRRYALLEPDLEFGKAKTQKNERVNSFSTFMHEIPTKTRDDLLEFLSELRTNPDFLATRITSLSQQELASLTTFRQALDPIDSVMALQARGKPVPSAQKSQALSGSSAVERLLSFQRHDPLSALIYTIFANSSGPDSAEDLRRTDIWATTCARLITEGKPGSDKFIKSVLDAWAGMREWPGKINLELYLMEVLQDGQFLLEKTEEPARQRGQPETRSTKDTIAADEFYDRSVLRLFEVIDDEPSAGGIPEGILEIGMAILKKLEDSRKHRTAAQTFIVSRWFFSTYLLNAIIHPESQGIMTGHHITEHARQKILKEIAIRAQKQVLDMTYNWKQAVPILPEIRHHIDNIMNRFKTRSHSKPVLLPAKAITSPRETVEVQPFVVMCPSDIITIVNSLYPERRPSSSHTEDGHHRGLASGASSISGVSLPFRNPSISGDASSILSQSAASSMTSDTTSREPLLEPHVGPVESHHPLTTGDNYPGHESKVEPTEEYGRKIRSTCSEMTRVLGLDATGSCHPCAEKWSVLYVSSGGKELRTRMRKDTESEEEPDEDSTESESDDEGVNDRMELESDYHSIKVAIVKLVEEYEIPKELAPESESKGFSNRTSAIRREARPMGPNRAASAPLGDRNPYHSASQSQLSTMFASQRGTPPSRMRAHGRTNSNADLKDSGAEKPSVLIIMLEAAMNQCQARSDFVNAHLYFKTLQHLRKIQSPSLTRNGYAALLNYFGRGPRESLAKSSSAIEEFEAWFVWLKQSQERHDEAIEDMMAGMKTLRDKMWYITDVRNSAGYEEAKNVALALKIMGQPTKTPDGKPVQTHRPRNPSKVANNFLLKTEAQVLDLMAAPTDHGGPNKLADEQSDMTLRWLKQYAIESSFCKGEERIHRFCLEIDKCVNKLVGDGILDGPVLWSSELYRRDKEVLDTGRQKGDLFLTGVGTLSIAGDEEYESHPGKSSLRSLDFAQRPSNSSLRSVHRNGSQQSFDSGKWSGSRPIDLMDSQDYFGGSSPVLSIDSSNTFWSPFQTQAASSPTSATSIRPGSSRGTVMLKQSATVNEDKRRFLLDLKQTLTGLLLSDLGTIVFSSGSETDAWFSGDLGEECIARKEEEEKRRKRAARKKSMRNLRSAAKEQRGPGSEHHSSTEHSSSGTDATARSSAISAKKAGLLEFPFNSAFRRLLHKFATHPNPFSKLHALYELELLIIASLSSRTGRNYSRRETLPTVPQSPTLGSVPEYSSREATANHFQAQNLEEAIANCEGRRSHSMMNGDEAASASYRNGARSLPGPPSTDMIVDVLTGLFRDAEIRPKTLFRDLQYIASFVPAQMLDKTARGKAFWDAGLAALGLKQDICRIMVEIADDIVALNTQNRSAALQHAANSSSGASEKAGVTSATVAPSPDDPLNKFTMEDAARMLIITAKEGDAVAERELAIFYLTHPDLLPRTTLPLTKPTEVFKAELLQRDRKREDPARSDPITMCVAQHWMEMSKRGGDQLATKYLRARDEMERIP